MSKLKSLEWYADFATELYENPENVEQRTLWTRIDDMDNCAVTIPQAILDQSWVDPNAKFAVTLCHDIIQAVVRFLASKEARIDGVPISSKPDEKQKIDGLETVLRFQYARMNQRGKIPTSVQVAQNAAKYCAVAMRTLHTKYEAKRKVGKEFVYSQAEREEMTYCGDWNWIVRNIHNVYPVWSDNKVLKQVVEIGVCTLFDIVNEYGEEHPAVRKAIAEAAEKKWDASDLRSINVSKFDYMDAGNRCVGFCLNGSGTDWSLGEEQYELLREEHKIGFLPWVVKDFGEPLLKGVADSGLYGRLAEMRAIFASKALGQIAKTNDYISDPNPANPSVIESGDPTMPNMMGMQTRVMRLPPEQIDPQLMTFYQELKGELVSSAAARALLEVESMLGRAQVGTLNAAQNTAMAQLGLVEKVIKLSTEEAIHQMVRWTWETEELSMGYRMEKGRDTQLGAQGAAFSLRGTKTGELCSGSNDIVFPDPQQIYVDVKLQPAYVQDEQATFNTVITKRNAGVSKHIALEAAGIDVNLNDLYILDETLEGAVYGGRVAEIQGESQIKMQMAGAEAQQAALAEREGGQPGVQPTQGTQTRDMNGAAQFQGTKGMDTRTGGRSPAEVVPGENRNTLNGTDDTGRPLV
jgi:hypothetical protein